MAKEGLAAAPKPPWLKIRPPSGERYLQIKEVLRTRDLHTVCEEAHCPNVAECWGGGTATFMLMGDTCTRGCRFCHVKTARQGLALDPDEPRKVADAVEAMGLGYVVITSVDRDDLPDGGAGHFAACVDAIRAARPHTLIEVLIPDFVGHAPGLDVVAAAGPHVIAHNVETIERLTPRVRDPRATYAQSLGVLRHVKANHPSIYTKSSLMVGLGESEEELREAMRDLRGVGVDVLTLGQYLRPSAQHLPVVAYVPPATFDRYRDIAQAMGFLYVASGPLVRSSYRAGEFFLEGLWR